MEEFVHTRGGEGAGDIIGVQNVAAAWAAHYNRRVHLCLHWGFHDKDYKVVKSDSESIEDRYRHVHERMWKNDMFSYENVWGSDMFEFADMLMHDNDLRRKHKPKRWIFESGDVEDPMGIPFSAYNSCEWRWEDLPTDNKKIIFWNHENNKENIKNYKDYPFHSLLWRDIGNSLNYLFPDHEIVEVSYRDDFRYVYDQIRECSFCIGYDGMWHTVAKNFGKLFVTCTHDIRLSHTVTNPHAAVFAMPEQFYEYLQNCAYTEGFLQREQENAWAYHSKRLARHTKRLALDGF